MKAIKNLLGGLLLVIILIIIDREIGGDNPMKKFNTMFWAWVCLLALAGLGLANSYLNAQQVPIFYAALEPQIRGQVVCNRNDEMAILISDNFDPMDTTSLRRVIEHEMVHISQIRALGGCIKAGEVYKKDPLEQELPAYKKELLERMKEGDAEQVLSQFLFHMHQLYGRGRSVDYVMDRINVVCLGGSNDSS